MVNRDGSEPGFKMARMHKNNPAYQAAVDKIAKDLRQAIELDTLTEDIAGPVMKGVFVESVLLDWRNVQEKDGTPIPYSKEAAEKLFDELPDLYMLLVDEAKKLGNFRTKEIEEVSKKSSLPSKTPTGKTGI